MEWYELAAAVATATAVHGAMEPNNVNDKLERLAETIKTGKVRKPMIEGLDTRAKSFMVFVVFMALSTGLSYLVISWVEPSLDAAMQYTIGVLLVGEILLTAGVDRYHVAMEKVTQSQAKGKK